MLPDTIKYPDIFNPEKSNLPVKGISKKQAEAFCQWRSDRLNEYILIREGILKIDINQTNEETFNTESYLSFQYKGLVRNDLFDLYTKKTRQVIHLDFFLLPAFYIASKEEIKICDSLIKIKNIKSRKKIKSDLDNWFRIELEISVSEHDNSPIKSFKSRLPRNGYSDYYNTEKCIKKYKSELAKGKIDFDISKVIFSYKDYRTFNLYKFKSQMRYYKPISDSLPNPFVKTSRVLEQKDSLGKMNYIYIADNYDGTPICIYKSAFEDTSTGDISKSGFYCAMNIPFRLYLKMKELSLIWGYYKLDIY